MSHKLRLPLFATAAALMALLLLPSGTLAASNHPHSIAGTLGSQGIHKSARASAVCGIVVAVPVLCEYAYIYDKTDEMVPLEGSFTFDTNGPLSAGITHAAGSSTITVATPGLYQVTYSVSGVQANQLALFVNGVVVPETIYGVGSAFSQNTGSALITLPAGAAITLRNHTSLGPVELFGGQAGTQPGVYASIIIQQIGVVLP